MRRGGVVQTIQDAIGFAKIVRASLGLSYSLYLQHEAHDGDASETKDEAWGHAQLLYKPLASSESLFVQLGDERVSIATKERRWQIDVADGEVIVRALAEGGAYIHLRPDGSVDVHAETIKLGGSATQLVALSSLVMENLTSLKSAITDAAVVGNDGGAAFQANILAALEDWPGEVAASKVRAE